MEPIGVSLVETELPAGASEAVRRLALLDTVERRQLIVKAFVEGRRLPDIEKLVGPIRELDPCVPAPPDRRHRRTLPIALVGGAALAAIALLSSTGSTGTSDLATQGERLISTTSAPVVETTEPSVPLVVAPDRQVELIIEAGVVVRLDPSTRERLWSTSAFDDVSIIDVNGDIITIDSAGRRLYLSLRDGTLLPP